MSAVSALKVFTLWNDTKVSYNHANQAFRLTTSNFSNSSALNFLLSESLNWLTGLISWTKPQVQARSHPNLLASIVWLNNLYHAQVAETGNSEKNDHSENIMKGVDLNTPLSYADRFRIRKPGVQWNLHPPHVDGASCLQTFNFLPIHEILVLGGTMERWQDPVFRKCFENILNGNWRDHDPFALEGRLNARNSLHGLPNQSSIFRTFQGWLAMR